MLHRKALIAGGLAIAVCAAAAAYIKATTPTARLRTAAISNPQPIVGQRWTPPPTPASLQLQGSVIDMGNAASGTATIRVGATVSTAPVTLPDYSVTIQSTQPDDMVSIEIETAGYKYASIFGSYRKLADHAGSDAQLTVAELDRLRLSPISTALYFFLKRDLDERMPVSDFEHEEMIRSVPSTDVGIAATVLDGLDNATLVLPAEYPNGYALLEDRAGYSNYLTAHPEADDDQTSYLSSTPSIPMQSAYVGENVLLTGPVFRSDATLFGPWVQILTATPDGYAVHIGLRRNASFTRQLVSGDLELTPQNEVSWEWLVTRLLVPGQPNSQVLERHDLVRTTLRRQFAGDRYSLWIEVAEWSVWYPEYPDYPATTEIRTGFWTASELGQVSPGYRPGLAAGDHALPLFCKGKPGSGWLEQCDYGLHKVFADGTGRTENVGPKVDANLQPIGAFGGEGFQWRNGPRDSLSNWFQIDYSGTTVTYWWIDAGDSASDLLVYIASAQDGEDTLTLAGSAAMIHADGSAGFNEVSPDGTWRYASFEQYPAPYAYNESNFPLTDRFNRNPDGTGVQTSRSQVPEFPYSPNWRFGWQLFDGRLYDTRYRANVSTGDPSTFYFSSCAQAYARGATWCYPDQVRYFRPLARSGNRLYGIEDRYLRSRKLFSRGQYHEKL